MTIGNRKFPPGTSLFFGFSARRQTRPRPAARKAALKRCGRENVITHRKDAIYPATIVGIPPMEDFYIGGASVKLFLPIFKMNFPENVDLALPPACRQAGPKASSTTSSS